MVEISQRQSPHIIHSSPNNSNRLLRLPGTHLQLWVVLGELICLLLKITLRSSNCATTSLPTHRTFFRFSRMRLHRTHCFLHFYGQTPRSCCNCWVLILAPFKLWRNQTSTSTSQTKRTLLLAGQVVIHLMFFQTHLHSSSRLSGSLA